MKIKIIENFPNYVIYEDGRLYSHFSKKFLKPFKISRKNKNGIKEYQAFKLCSNGVEKTFQVHRLVACHFIPNPHNKLEVNHIDGNKLNNHVSNLEWVTHSENIQHAFKTGLNDGEKWQGIKHSRASFSENEVIEFCKKFELGLKPKDITGILNTKESLILYNKLFRIYKRDNWTSISRNYNW